VINCLFRAGGGVDFASEILWVFETPYTRSKITGVLPGGGKIFWAFKTPGAMDLRGTRGSYFLVLRR
jgi:hypothetical protein